MLMATIKVNKKKIFTWVLMGYIYLFEILHRFVFGLQQIARDTKVVIYKVVQ